MRSVLLLILFLAATSFLSHSTIDNKLAGAWQSGDENRLMTKIYSDKYFSVAIYNPKDNTFTGTAGGSWHADGDKLVEKFEFNTLHPDEVGKEVSTEFSLKGKTLELKAKSGTETWKQIDDGTPGKLAGAWLITGRVDGNGEERRRTPGVRKTMKILSGTRFQWIAYNLETKEFFGSGGGTYTTQDGKYTEKIEFFSRDNSRAGMSLQFDFSIQNGEWFHKGLSSKGDPIHEIWTKREVLENQSPE